LLLLEAPTQTAWLAPNLPLWPRRVHHHRHTPTTTTLRHRATVRRRRRTPVYQTLYIHLSLSLSLSSLSRCVKDEETTMGFSSQILLLGVQPASTNLSPLTMSTEKYSREQHFFLVSRTIFSMFLVP